MHFGRCNELGREGALTGSGSRAPVAQGHFLFTSTPTFSQPHIRKSVTIDWTLRESTRAKIRVVVKRILNRFGYPPDLQEEAVKTVLKQVELLCAEWVS
ncbi:MAG TPA: type I restriction enzyme endonuclease domain-containing protein [Terriglobia bacterium]|nr:type I restriction enzyme endonuclease domain-containing protein [Terriglobia bacterium]